MKLLIKTNNKKENVTAENPKRKPVTSVKKENVTEKKEENMPVTKS